MDHGGMDHGGHGGMDHGNHSDMQMCSMNMVWNYDTTNLCILTSSWRITTPLSLYLSLSFIILIGVLYEYLRLYIRQLDARLARGSPSSTLLSTHRRRASLLPSSTSNASTSSIGGGRRSASLTLRQDREGRRGWIKQLETTRKVQVWRSALYATSVAVSFGLMLIGMTFNAWVIGAIALGAGLGHYLFNRELSSVSALAAAQEDKGLACHS